jgi:hypothetical protein
VLSAVEVLFPDINDEYLPPEFMHRTVGPYHHPLDAQRYRYAGNAPGKGLFFYMGMIEGPFGEQVSAHIEDFKGVGVMFPPGIRVTYRYLEVEDEPCTPPDYDLYDIRFTGMEKGDRQNKENR